MAPSASSRSDDDSLARTGVPKPHASPQQAQVRAEQYQSQSVACPSLITVARYTFMTVPSPHLHLQPRSISYPVPARASP